MNLSDLFAAIAHKSLVSVDLPDLGSHQHEINGTLALQHFFEEAGTSDGEITWHFFKEDEDPVTATGRVKFYDARAKSYARTGRSEWRLYYSGDFLGHASPGDLLVLVATRTGELLGLVFAKSSAWYRAALSLFDPADLGSEWRAVLADGLSEHDVTLLQQRILDQLDLEVTLPVTPSDEDLVVARFSSGFPKYPKTKEMSDFARSQIETDWHRGDEALSLWLEREEQLFYALEGIFVKEKLASGFRDAEDLIEFSISLNNRRKSRMGHSLQHHLKEVFTLNRLRFSSNARTEGNSQPDFLFPGEAEYHDRSFNPALLLMLGAKSTAKDRWRQILAEADKIRDKHLCTLEPAISEAQTDEMTTRHVTLVIPEKLHGTFTPKQQGRLLTVQGFIDTVQRTQGPGSVGTPT